jgi:hypothetical protein
MQTGFSLRTAFVVVASTALAACQDTQMARGTDGSAIGVSAEWKQVPSTDANFSILGDWSLVTGPWSNRFIQTRNQTSVRILNGFIFYESNASSRSDNSPRENLKVLYDIDLKIAETLGVSPESGNPRSVRSPFGRIDYAVWRGKDRICIGAMVFSDGMRRQYDNGDFYMAYARGGRCIDAANQGASSFEDVTLDLFKRISLDRGDSNKLRSNSNSQSRTDTRPAQSIPPPQIPQAAPPPSPASPPRELSVREREEQALRGRDIETRLRELMRLRDANLISQQEFEIRRKSILDQL